MNKSLKKSLMNWKRLCDQVIRDNAEGKDISRYAISKGNLHIETIDEWIILQSFVNSVLYYNVQITDEDLEAFK